MPYHVCCFVIPLFLTLLSYYVHEAWLAYAYEGPREGRHRLALASFSVVTLQIHLSIDFSLDPRLNWGPLLQHAERSHDKEGSFFPMY